MSKKARTLTIIVSAVAGIAIIAGAIWLSGAIVKSPVAVDEPDNPVSKQELAAANGKDGNICLVAVDGTVYEISGFALWAAGQHTPSNGEAYCGADMTESLENSPHGRSKLELLRIAGYLQQ